MIHENSIDAHFMVKSIGVLTLIDLLQQVAAKYPDAALYPNRVGNLSISPTKADDVFIGYIDVGDESLNY